MISEVSLVIPVRLLEYIASYFFPLLLLHKSSLDVIRYYLSKKTHYPVLRQLSMTSTVRNRSHRYNKFSFVALSADDITIRTIAITKLRQMTPIP